MKNRMLLFLVTLAATFAFVLANVFVQRQMESIIKEEKLVDEAFVAEGTPPVIALSTMALGGFRGIVADVLWLRAMDLQQQARFFELVQLSDWILKLQPKFSGAASHLGWNMSYNISVATKSPEDRWRWVRRGILLMQKAIELDPNDGDVYKEIAWIYAHKLGNVLDDAQRYYKLEMSRELLAVLGTHYPDWQAINDAPADEAALKKLYPKDHEVWSILAAAGFDNIDMLFGEFRLRAGMPDSLKGKLSPDDEKNITNYIRRQWLKEDWCVDPKYIVEINNKYGELDWLLPESFAIYWAHVGNYHSRDSFDFACYRQLLQSLVASFNYGRMLLPKDNEASEFFLLIPNTGLAESTRDTYKELLTHTEFNTTTFKALFENFLIDTTVTLYGYGQKSKAREFYDEILKETDNKEAKSMTFEQFVLWQWEDDLKDPDFKQANDQLTGLVTQACLLLAYGDREAATQHLLLAQRVYKSYTEDKSGLDRLSLPPFNEIKSQVTQAIMTNIPSVADRLRGEIAADQERARNGDENAVFADSESAGQDEKSSSTTENK